jgi:alkylhydroperoxidase/carboxymuconolactone decarboxylase family protein YurZ
MRTGEANHEEGRDDVETSERQRRLREEYVAVRGYWDESLDSLLELDPDFFEAYLHLSAVPWRSGHLEPKVRELVSIAVAGAATGPYAPALRLHVHQALELGAAKEEVLEALQLTSTLGIHACNIGIPILLEELEAAGHAVPAELSARQELLKADFTAKRGYWHEFWNGLLELDPDFFEAYLEFSSLPWTQGVLDPKVKELVYTAFDVAATHLYVPGLRQHVRNAIGLGATAGELMEVFELASTLGIRTCELGVPMLLEALGERAGA